MTSSRWLVLLCLLKDLAAQASMSSGRSEEEPSISFPGPQEALCLPLLGNFCQPSAIRHIRLCDPQLVWSRMSGPEKLIKTLHKRKVALQNQHYRVHCHHRHRHHRRHPHHHHHHQQHHHNHHHHHHHPIRRPCTSVDGADWQSLEKPTMNTLSLMTMWDLYQHYLQIDMAHYLTRYRSNRWNTTNIFGSSSQVRKSSGSASSRLVDIFFFLLPEVNNHKEKVFSKCLPGSSGS